MFGYILHALTLSVTIIVVAVPEGLPMMITLVLSSNMKRMLKSNVLVRKLMGIETAGNINILFTDKTGTITKGKLEVIGISDADGNIYHDEKELRQNQDFYKLVKLSLTGNMEVTIDGIHPYIPCTIKPTIKAKKTLIIINFLFKKNHHYYFTQVIVIYSFYKSFRQQVA